mmetsp:Transcript_24171/g.43321  ORF Transcript_24171/g.43321 Transcript_24171/m.43321 type:complete len:283 (-) Transcript_24171:2000-2848(-)
MICRTLLPRWLLLLLWGLSLSSRRILSRIVIWRISSIGTWSLPLLRLPLLSRLPLPLWWPLLLLLPRLPLLHRWPTSWSHLPWCPLLLLSLLHWWLTLCWRSTPSSPLALHRRWLLLTTRSTTHVWMRGRISRSGHVSRRRTTTLLPRWPLLLRWISRWILPPLAGRRATTLLTTWWLRISRWVLTTRTSSLWSTHLSAWPSGGGRDSKLREGVSSWLSLRIAIVTLEDGSLDLIDATSESTPDTGASLPNRLTRSTGTLPYRTLGRLAPFLRAIPEHTQAS